MKTYFIAPNFSTAPPPNGSLDLGHVIAGPTDTVIEPINRKTRIEPPELLPVDVKSAFSTTESRLSSGNIGIWAQIAAAFGVHASIDGERSSENTITIPKLETHCFIPTLEYLHESLASPEVRVYMTTTAGSVPVYMITGLKIARGASVSKAKRGAFGGSLGIDIPLEGVQLGPNAAVRKEKTEGEAFDESTDFILAYQIRRLRFKKNVLEQQVYFKGAKMMDGEGEAVKEPTAHEFLGIDDSEAGIDLEDEGIDEWESVPSMVQSADEHGDPIQVFQLVPELRQ